MALLVEITHVPPTGSESTKLGVVYIEEEQSGSGEGWLITLFDRVPGPVIALLNANHVQFRYDPDNNLFAGDGPLPSAVIGELVRLPYTLKS